MIDLSETFSRANTGIGLALIALILILMWYTRDMHKSRKR